MSQMLMEAPVQPVQSLEPERRGQFLIRTYAHLYAAVMLFAGIDYVLFATGAAPRMAEAMLSVNWGLVLGAYVLVSWMAARFARMDTTRDVQYTAFVVYVMAEAVLFVPLLYIAQLVAPGALNGAIYATVAGFTALTAIVAWTGKDFSFLRGFLAWGGMTALVVIVGALLFHFPLGAWFDVAMIAFAGAAILYDTSKVMRFHGEGNYVAASLQLFASVALMFWYVLRLFINMRR